MAPASDPRPKWLISAQLDAYEIARQVENADMASARALIVSAFALAAGTAALLVALANVATLWWLAS